MATFKFKGYVLPWNYFLVSSVEVEVFAQLCFHWYFRWCIFPIFQSGIMNSTSTRICCKVICSFANMCYLVRFWIPKLTPVRIFWLKNIGWATSAQKQWMVQKFWLSRHVYEFCCPNDDQFGLIFWTEDLHGGFHLQVTFISHASRTLTCDCGNCCGWLSRA